MLDAFIIEDLQKEQEQKEWKPVPLTMELPLAEDEVTDPDKTEKQDEATIVFRF